MSHEFRFSLFRNGARHAANSSSDARLAASQPVSGGSALMPPSIIRLFVRCVVNWAACLLSKWQRRLTESEELSLLSHRDLRDFGVNQYEINFATRKMRWRPWC